MDKILEKWDEILYRPSEHEHDVSDISFDTWIQPSRSFWC